MPASYNLAIVLQNQDAPRNVWSTLQWFHCVEEENRVSALRSFIGILMVERLGVVVVPIVCGGTSAANAFTLELDHELDLFQGVLRLFLGDSPWFEYRSCASIGYLVPIVGGRANRDRCG